MSNKFANEKNNTYICIKKRDKKMSKHDYTVAQLEKIVFNQSRCYSDSEAFQTCLDFIKEVNYPLYKDVLYKEAIECGGINE